MAHVKYSSSFTVIKLCCQWHTWNIRLPLLLSNFVASGTRGMFVFFYCYQTLLPVAHVEYSSSFTVIKLLPVAHVEYSSSFTVIKLCCQWHTWNILLLLLLSKFVASGTRGIVVVFYCYQTLCVHTQRTPQQHHNHCIYCHTHVICDFNRFYELFNEF